MHPFYAIERKLREDNAPPSEILRTRKETAAQIVENLFKKLQDKLADTANPPLNKLQEAIDYALKRRETLQSRLANPCLPIDNNTVERAVRPVAVGRKNYLFIGAPEAGQRSAVLYTMLGECKRCGVDPLAWLTHVLRILPAYRGTDYAALLPGSLTLPRSDGPEERGRAHALPDTTPRGITRQCSLPRTALPVRCHSPSRTYTMGP